MPVTPIPGGGVRASTYNYGTQWGQPLGAKKTPKGAVAPTGPVAGGTNVNTQLSPQIQGFLDQYKDVIGRMKGAGPDPLLAEQVQNLRNRLSTDTTDRAINRATGSIADAAAGAKSGMRTALARRGVGTLEGEGVGGSELGKIDAAAQRAKAGASADISLKREQDLDRLVLGGQGIMGAPGQYGLQQNAQLLGALGQAGGLAGEQERLGQGWAGLNLEGRRTDLAGNEQAMSQWLALMRMFQ